MPELYVVGDACYVEVLVSGCGSGRQPHRTLIAATALLGRWWWHDVMMLPHNARSLVPASMILQPISSTLQDGAYSLFTEIIIAPGRHVTLQGDPVMMPLIDCQLSVRCFRVKVRNNTEGVLPFQGWMDRQTIVAQPSCAIVPSHSFFLLLFQNSQAGGRLDARHLRMNTGKGAVEARVSGLPINEDAPGPLANKVRKRGIGVLD